MEIPLIPRILLELEMQTGYYLNEKLHKVNYTVNVWNRCFRTKVLSTYCCFGERKEIYLYIIQIFLSGFNGQHDSVAIDSYFFLLSFISSFIDKDTKNSNNTDRLPIQFDLNTLAMVFEAQYY